jgi:S-adenosylmethionine-dependent methyltransferase
MADPTTDPETFANHLETWHAWQQEPWGRMRYSVVWHVLQQHLRPLGDRLRILDVGGGDGVEAVRLAGVGHHVTIADYSAPMLAEAMVAASRAGVADRVVTVEASADDLGSVGGRSSFDVALCHFVVQYSADPGPVLDEIGDRVRPGGLLSLVAPNPASDVLAKAVRDLDPAGAIEMLDATHMHAQTFDHDVRRIEPSDAERLVHDSGFEVVHRYGGRCVMDLITNDDAKRDPQVYAALEALEHRLCAISPYRDIGRFWQIIATRRTRSG